MSDTTKILESLGEPFPQQAIKVREGGRGKMLSYVEGFTVIRRLNTVLPGGWSFAVTGTDIRPWGTTRNGQPQYLVLATVALDIPELGRRSHVGVQIVSEGAGEDLFKGAVTDGLKKAATLFGVGLELYGPDYEAGEMGLAPNGSYQQQRSAPHNNPPQQGLGFQQQRPQASPERPASDKQLGYINKLAAEKGIDRADLHAQAGVPSLKELSSKGASDLIEWLQSCPSLIPAGPRQEPQRGWEQGQRAFEDLPDPEPPDYDHYTN